MRVYSVDGFTKTLMATLAFLSPNLCRARSLSLRFPLAPSLSPFLSLLRARALSLSLCPSVCLSMSISFSFSLAHALSLSLSIAFCVCVCEARDLAMARQEIEDLNRAKHIKYPPIDRPQSGIVAAFSTRSLLPGAPVMAGHLPGNVNPDHSSIFFRNTER